MDQRYRYLIAGLFGIALAMLVTAVTGWLAALPIPGAVLRNFNHQSTLMFIFTAVVFIDVPVMVLSFAAGLVLFRALRPATAALVVVCAAPWLLYCGYDMIHAFAGSATATKRDLLFSLFTWSSIFTVPAGLFLASLLRVSGSLPPGRSTSSLDA
jgi:hypothetical protein